LDFACAEAIVSWRKSGNKDGPRLGSPRYYKYSGVSIKIGKIKSLSCKVGEQKATKLGKLPWGSAVQGPVVLEYVEMKEHVWGTESHEINLIE